MPKMTQMEWARATGKIRRYESVFMPHGVARIPWGIIIVSKIKDLKEARFYLKIMRWSIKFYVQANYQRFMKEKKNYSKDLYEQFTIQGFFAVSAWSLLFWFQGLAIFAILEAYGISFNVKSGIIYYLIIWFICFLLLCLIPKLRGEK